MFKEMDETHSQGIISISEDYKTLCKDLQNADLGIQIGYNGRVWVCIDGIAFIRFKPSLKEIQMSRETGDKFFFEVEYQTSTQYHTEVVHGTITAVAEYQLNQCDNYKAKISVTKLDSFTKGVNHYIELED